MSIRVLVVDDHAAVRAGIRAVLEPYTDVEVVGEAADGRSALGQARALLPDVVLMDVRMPHLDGIAATAALAHGEAKVLILTTFALDDYVDEALAAGAVGYLLKSAEAHEIVDAVRAVAAGDAVLAPEVTMRVIERVRSQHTSAPARPEELEELTAREREVLLGLGEGLSNASIAERMRVSETTVKTHVSHVLAKLGVTSRMAAAVIARDAGLV